MRSTKNRLTHNSMLRGWVMIWSVSVVVTFTTLPGGTQYDWNCP